MLKFKFGYDTETYTLFSSSSSNITRVGCCEEKIITLYNQLIEARVIFFYLRQSAKLHLIDFLI